MVVRPHDLEDMRVLAAQVLAEIPASAYRRESVQTTSQTSHPPPPGISAIGSVDSHSSRRRTRRRRPRRRRTRHSRTRRRRTLRRRRRRRACTRRNSSRSSCARSTRARLLSGRPSVNRRRRRRRSMTATASCRPPLPARRRQPGRTTRTAAGWTATSRRCRHGRRRLHGRRRRHRAAPPQPAVDAAPEDPTPADHAVSTWETLRLPQFPPLDEDDWLLLSPTAPSWSTSNWSAGPGLVSDDAPAMVRALAAAALAATAADPVPFFPATLQQVFSLLPPLSVSAPTSPAPDAGGHAGRRILGLPRGGTGHG